MRKKVTMEQLAAELGLSRLTVSKALKGGPGMSADTRRAVLELAEKRGYRTREQLESAALEHAPLQFQPRRFAFVLAGERMALPDIHMKLLQGVAERYRSLRSEVLPVFLPPEGTGTDGLDAWIDESGLLHFDGVFIPPMLQPGQEKFLLRLPLPRILINFPPSGAMADSVVWDGYEAVRQAVGYLAAAGRTLILYVGDNQRSSGYRWRWAAFRDAMEEAGLPVAEEEHVTGARDDLSVWQASVAARLRERRPSAVLSAIEHETPWLSYLCEREGLRVPKDCEIVCLDHSETGPEGGSGAFVYLPVKETGYRAADRMMWRIANPNVPYEHIRVQGRLIEREARRSKRRG